MEQEILEMMELVETVEMLVWEIRPPVQCLELEQLFQQPLKDAPVHQDVKATQDPRVIVETRGVLDALVQQDVQETHRLKVLQGVLDALVIKEVQDSKARQVARAMLDLVEVAAAGEELSGHQVRQLQ